MIKPMFQLLELKEQDFRRIKEIIYEHCGINLTDEKKELVRSRLAKHVRRNNLNTYKDYIDLVLSDRAGPEFTTFVNRLSTNLTSFFRESKHFDYFQDVFLPKRLAQSSGPFRLRGWSAACSSGEEPYTLAMTLKESLPTNRTTDVKILASDISTKVLDMAKAGRYSEERLNSVSRNLQQKYFRSSIEPNGEKVFQVTPALREMVIFKQINLMNSWPFTTKLDFIFCRNVLIYFDKETHRKLAERFYETLVPGGVLFLGHSESLSSIKHSFKSVAPAIYIKQ